MANKLKELLEKRKKAHEDARAILEKAEKEGRSSLNTEERAAYDKAYDEFLNLGDTVERHKKLEEAEATFEKSEKEKESERGKKSAEKSANSVLDTEDYRGALLTYLRDPKMVTPDEQRVLQQGVGPDGGYLVPKQQMLDTIIKFVDDQAVVRGLTSNVIRMEKAQSLGALSFDTDMGDPGWTTELGTGSEDTSAKFGMRELNPHAIARRVKISRTLLRNSAFPIDTFILQRMAYKFAIAEDQYFQTGNGANQPLGLFTASASGISTGRDVATEMAETYPTFDGLKNVKYTLKPQYWAKAKWLMHRLTLKLVDKLKDGEGQYIFQSSVVQGAPDRLLGFPIVLSEFSPHTYTTGQYISILGDFDFFWIADSMQFETQRLNELYAETNQVGFIGRKETDAMPVLEEAFVRAKLA